MSEPGYEDYGYDDPSAADYAAGRYDGYAKQAQVWLGHHKASFTIDTYTHLLPDDLPDPAFFDALTASATQGGNKGATQEAEKGRNATRRLTPKTLQRPATPNQREALSAES